MWKAVVYVTIKEGVLDPQGTAVERAPCPRVSGSKRGANRKYVELMIDAADRSEAEARLRQMCETLLANPEVEDYRYELEVVPS